MLSKFYRTLDFTNNITINNFDSYNLGESDIKYSFLFIEKWGFEGLHLKE